VGAFDHLEKRVKKEREKLRGRKRRKIRPKVTYPSMIEEGERPKKVIRSRNYTMKPLSIDEARMQLDASKENVFLFRMMGTEEWAVLFKRKDGNFGLIEPK